MEQKNSYTKAELETYDKFWDTIRTEKTLIADAEAKGKIEGKIEGEQIGIQKEKIETVLKAYNNGIPIPLIANISSITEEEVIRILKEKGKVVGNG